MIVPETIHITRETLYNIQIKDLIKLGKITNREGDATRLIIIKKLLEYLNENPNFEPTHHIPINAINRIYNYYEIVDREEDLDVTFLITRLNNIAGV